MILGNSGSASGENRRGIGGEVTGLHSTNSPTTSVPLSRHEGTFQGDIRLISQGIETSRSGREPGQRVPQTGSLSIG